MEILGAIATIIATIGLKNILILLAAGVAVIWATIGAIVFLIKKSDVEKIGFIQFDTEEDKPKPRKRRILKRKV